MESTIFLERVGQEFAESIIDLLAVEPDRRLAQGPSERFRAKMGGQSTPLYAEGVKAVIQDALRQAVHAGCRDFLEIVLSNVSIKLTRIIPCSRAMCLPSAAV